MSLSVFNSNTAIVIANHPRSHSIFCASSWWGVVRENHINFANGVWAVFPFVYIVKRFPVLSSGTKEISAMLATMPLCCTVFVLAITTLRLRLFSFFLRCLTYINPLLPSLLSPTLNIKNFHSYHTHTNTFPTSDISHVPSYASLTSSNFTHNA